MFYLNLVHCLLKSEKNEREKNPIPLGSIKKSKNAYVRVNTDKHVQKNGPVVTSGNYAKNY